MIYLFFSIRRSADAELQQRACEYLALSKHATLDVLATVLEEMPPFPEKESCGLLNLLKKKRPGRVPDNPEIKASNDGDHNKSGSSANATLEIANTNNNNTSGGSADLLGLGEKIFIRFIFCVWDKNISVC